MRSPGSDGNNVRPEVPGKHVIKRAMPYREKIALTMEKHLTAWKGQKKQGFFTMALALFFPAFFTRAFYFICLGLVDRRFAIAFPLCINGNCVLKLYDHMTRGQQT